MEPFSGKLGECSQAFEIARVSGSGGLYFHADDAPIRSLDDKIHLFLFSTTKMQ